MNSDVIKIDLFLPSLPIKILIKGPPKMHANGARKLNNVPIISEYSREIVIDILQGLQYAIVSPQDIEPRSRIKT